MVCRVLAWQNAVAWIQQHLIAANAGPKKGNRAGHQRTVFQKFWHQLAPKFKILPSLLPSLKQPGNNHKRFSTPQTTAFSVLWFFIGQLS